MIHPALCAWRQSSLFKGHAAAILGVDSPRPMTLLAVLALEARPHSQPRGPDPTLSKSEPLDDARSRIACGRFGAGSTRSQSMKWFGPVQWITKPNQSSWIWTGLDQEITNMLDSGLDWIRDFFCVMSEECIS